MQISSYPDQTFSTKAAAVAALVNANFKRWVIIREDESQGGNTAFYFYDGTLLRNINLPVDLNGYARLNATENNFAGDIIVGDGVRLTGNTGQFVIYQNCKVVDTGGGIYQVQATGGRASYFIISPDGIAFYSAGMQQDGNFPLFAQILAFDADGAVFYKPEVIYFGSGGAEVGKVIGLNAINNAIEFNFYASSTIAGGFFEFYCVDHTNGVQCVAHDNNAAETALFYLKNDPGTPVSRFNLYKGDTLRMYHNGITFRQW